MKYENTTLQKGLLVKKAVVESVDETPKTSKKAHVRKKIHDEVFDLNDSVADNAKIISLTLTLLSRIYDVLPDDIKANLIDTDKQLIELAFGKFKTTITRGDVQFAKEGVGMINKILDRQNKVGEIVS